MNWGGEAHSAPRSKTQRLPVAARMMPVNSVRCSRWCSAVQRTKAALPGSTTSALPALTDIPAQRGERQADDESGGAQHGRADQQRAGDDRVTDHGVGLRASTVYIGSPLAFCGTDSACAGIASRPVVEPSTAAVERNRSWCGPSAVRNAAILVVAATHSSGQGPRGVNAVNARAVAPPQRWQRPQ